MMESLGKLIPLDAEHDPDHILKRIMVKSALGLQGQYLYSVLDKIWHVKL